MFGSFMESFHSVTLTSEVNVQSTVLVYVSAGWHRKLRTDVDEVSRMLAYGRDENLTVNISNRNLVNISVRS